MYNSKYEHPHYFWLAPSSLHQWPFASNKQKHKKKNRWSRCTIFLKQFQLSNTFRSYTPDLSNFTARDRFTRVYLPFRLSLEQEIFPSNHFWKVSLSHQLFLSEKLREKERTVISQIRKTEAIKHEFESWCTD